MNVKELRIGNTLKNGVVDSITNTCVWFDNQEFVLIDELEPINLTEEWLVDFGFEKHSTNPFWFRKKNLCVSLVGRVELISWDMQIFKIDAKVDFAHQLQNLYQLLNNEELTHQKIN